MGFRFKRIDFVAGSENFPVGNNSAMLRIRCEAVLKAAAEALISMDIGWELDSTRQNDSSTTSDFAESPCRSGSNTYPALFLRNTVSGCKLYLAYYGGMTNAANCVKDFSAPSAASHHVDIFCYGDAHINGLCASIIAEGSQQTFGQTFDSSFLPNDATRIMGTCFYYESTNTAISFCCNPTSGYHYSWGIFATDRTIAVCANYNSSSTPNLGHPVYVTGKLFGNLAHDADNATNSKYGTFIFRNGVASSSVEGTQSLLKYTISNQTTSGIVPLRKMFGSDPIYGYTTASISRVNGTWANAQPNSDVNVTGYVADFFQITSNGYTPSASETKWLPISVSVISTDLTTYGVVPGDGFKGWLDTDLFRCAVSTYGTMYANGKFICPENDFNMLIGWESTNTDSISGN